MDKESGNRKRSTKGKVATERVQMGSSRHKKEKKKGRATGGIIKRVKLWIKEKRQEKREEEGCMEIKVHIGNKWWKIVTIYGKEMKTTRRRRRRNERKQGGDFNGRTGERGARNWEKGDGKRKSKDKMENAEGMEWIEENGWIVNEEIWERVEEIRIGEKSISK
jgi:hypothetical protein